MDDAKLQLLHDTLAQLRGHNGLGTGNQYSWQRGATTEARHPAAASLPDNALYANFLPEGLYDSQSALNDGDGRTIMRDFADFAVGGDDGSRDECSTADESVKRRRKQRRKAEKKAALKAEKLEAKRHAKLEEKKRQKKESKENLRLEISGQSLATSSSTSNDVDICTPGDKKKSKKRSRVVEQTRDEPIDGDVVKLPEKVKKEKRRKRNATEEQAAGESSTPPERQKAAKKKKKKSKE